MTDMNLFSFLWRGTDAKTSDQVRELLFDAVRRGDQKALLSACTKYNDTILSNFDSWRKLPEHVRNDQAALQSWGNALVATAQVMRAIGHPELMRMLMMPDDAPIASVPGELQHAQQLSERGDYARSTAILEPLLAEIADASGAIIDDLRPKLLGLLGTNYFHLGRHDLARQYTERALADCQRIGDKVGIRTYQDNLRFLAAQSPGGAASESERNILKHLIKAQGLSDNGRFADSNAVLDALPLSSPDVATYLGKIHGLKGFNHFRLGDKVLAQLMLDKAVEHCRRTKDIDGVRIYLHNQKIIASA
jgi:tetratricopeptide (TPR) repeat protein